MTKRIGLLVLSVALAFASAPLSAKTDTDRVNLWPLLSIDGDVVDFIWPLTHFEGDRCWWVFPFFKDRNTFVLFPELWFNEDTFAVLPLAAKYNFESGTLFPVFWWDFERSRSKMHSVFPLYYYHGRGSDATFWAGCGLFGYISDGYDPYHWAVPFYWKHKDTFLSIPYSSWRNTHGSTRDVYIFMLGLGGCERSLTGSLYSHWLFPLYAKNKSGFYSLPFSLGWDPDGRVDSWCVPPLLSGGWRNGSDWKRRYLLGLGGYDEKDGGSWDSWLFPLYYADSDGRVVTPLYGQGTDCMWSFPLFYKSAHSFVSPFWYQRTDDKGRVDRWVVPFLLSGGFRDDGCSRNSLLLNIAGWKSEDSGRFSSWLFPLYYADNDGMLITPLYGRVGDNQWCFPLWYSDERSVYSPFWCQTNDDKGNLKSWILPWLLSAGGYEDNGAYEVDVLLGLGGARWDGGYRSSWCLPLYYENSNGTLVTPLFGRTGSGFWAAPLFYYDKDNFISLLYSTGHSESFKSDYYFVPALLSGYQKYDDGGSAMKLLMLYGHGTDGNGRTSSDYLFPLYSYDGKSGDFMSLIYGTYTFGPSERQQTNTWWLTPIVGTRSGAKTGGWFFPLFNQETDASFDKDIARMDSDVLPSDITASDKFSSHSSGSVLIIADNDHSVRGEVLGNVYQITEKAKRGNIMLFDHSSDRCVGYDIASRRKKYDISGSRTIALLGLYWAESSSDGTSGASHSHSRVLWKLWDREEKDGNVTLDVFPGFTYDSRTDGYTKTSFLWRFFRYESDPKEGTKVDLFFIPMWR